MSEDAIVENGHRFVTGASKGFGPESVLHRLLVCETCGIVRRRDGKSNPCRGDVRVALRKDETPIARTK